MKLFIWNDVFEDGYSSWGNVFTIGEDVESARKELKNTFLAKSNRGEGKYNEAALDADPIVIEADEYHIETHYRG